MTLLLLVEMVWLGVSATGKSCRLHHSDMQMITMIWSLVAMQTSDLRQCPPPTVLTAPHSSSLTTHGNDNSGSCRPLCAPVHAAIWRGRRFSAPRWTNAPSAAPGGVFSSGPSQPTRQTQTTVSAGCRTRLSERSVSCPTEQRLTVSDQGHLLRHA